MTPEERKAYKLEWCRAKRARVKAERPPKVKLSPLEKAERSRARHAKWKNENPEKAKSSTVAWKARNKHRISETNSAWYQNNLERAKASHTAYREKKPEKIKEITKLYSAKNVEKIVKRIKEWRAVNPEKYVAQQMSRRTSLRAGDIPRELVDLKILSLEIKRLNKAVKKHLKEEST